MYNLVACESVAEAVSDGYMIHCMSYAGVHSVGKLLSHFLLWMWWTIGHSLWWNMVAVKKAYHVGKQRSLTLVRM